MDNYLNFCDYDGKVLCIFAQMFVKSTKVNRLHEMNSTSLNLFFSL